MSEEEKTLKRAFADYKRGHLTRMEAQGAMVPLATVEELSWLKAEQPEWYDKFIEHADHFPADDDDKGWDNTIEIRSWCGGEEHAEEWYAGKAARTAKFRAGVKLIRDFHRDNN